MHRWKHDALKIANFLATYLRARGLPYDAVPRLTEQHRLLFAEYFATNVCALGNDRRFDRMLCAVVKADSDGPELLVGQVLLACSHAPAAGWGSPVIPPVPPLGLRILMTRRLIPIPTRASFGLLCLCSLL